MRHYAGIGSRETPAHILDVMAQIAGRMAALDFVLRSGGAGGADTAFEQGCDAVSGPKEIFIPWDGFSGRTRATPGNIVFVSRQAEAITAKFHPNWAACSQGARKLHARNVAQVLGTDLSTPSKMVICWTRNASGAGGTGQAIRIARSYGVPVFDLGCAKTLARLNKFIAK